jgi:hypothetical protein
MQLNRRSAKELCEKAGPGLAEKPCLPHDASYHAVFARRFRDPV